MKKITKTRFMAALDHGHLARTKFSKHYRKVKWFDCWLLTGRFGISRELIDGSSEPFRDKDEILDLMPFLYEHLEKGSQFEYDLVQGLRREAAQSDAIKASLGSIARVGVNPSLRSTKRVFALSLLTDHEGLEALTFLQEAVFDLISIDESDPKQLPFRIVEHGNQRVIFREDGKAYSTSISDYNTEILFTKGES